MMLQFNNASSFRIFEVKIMSVVMTIVVSCFCLIPVSVVATSFSAGGSAGSLKSNTTLLNTTLTRDYIALNAFKNAVHDPQGMLAGWQVDPCRESWNYITCSNTTENRTIIQLSLSNLQLGGEIPTALQNLKDLEVLDLGNNNFQGSMPNWLGNLSKLIILDVQSNQLSGTIPKELGQLKELVFLRITNNSFSGEIPDEFGGLSSLKILACENNLLEGSIPLSFSRLPISHLHMDHNKFSGSIPRWFGGFPELTHLVMNDNMLSGSLPLELGNCVKLQQLKLDNNAISGQIPATFGLLTNLSDLRLRNNSLHGSIPTSFNNLVSLHVLDLGCNNLDGNIPSNIGDLGNLIFLNLEGNNLIGDIPSSFGEFSNIEVINLGGNRLSGTIPDMGLSSNLLSVELEDNHLTGVIPSSLRKQNLDLLIYGNPLCTEAANSYLSGCNSNITSHVATCTPQRNSITGSEISSCNCPSGMILRPFGVGCDCVVPLLIQLFFPRILFIRCTKEKQERLAENLARELYLLSDQVIVQSAAQNGTGTDVTFLLISLSGISLDNSTINRIREKLYAPYLSAVWFDGEFGWFDYVVLHFIPPFSRGSTFQSSSIPVTEQSSSNRNIIPIIVGSVAGGLCILLLILGLFYALWKKMALQSSHNQKDIRDPSIIGSSMRVESKHMEIPSKIFTMDELNIAANNFCSDNLIGSGGFGAVYKGSLPDGKLVAIKKLSGLSDQGEEEFQNEVKMMVCRLHSPHIMQLLGYCSEADERILVYEFMSRGSLLDYLRGGSGKHSIESLDWKTRIQIALDAAKGLRYLHESDPPIVHRDVKPSNILLDEEFHARVADFGLSKLFPASCRSHVTTRVMGTFGYLAPDYSITGKLTVKSDVYSFGIVLLELLSGRNAVFIDDDGKREFLIHWARPLLKEKKKRITVLDSELQGTCPPKGIEMMVSLILSCLELDPDRRPNMVTVETILATISDIP